MTAQQPLFSLEPHTPLFSGVPLKSDTPSAPLRYSIPLYGIKLVREATIGYLDYPQVRMPTDCVKFLEPYFADLDVEQLVIVMLDTKSRVIGTKMVYHGNLNTVVIRIAEVFKPAIVANACGIIIAHNHPSSGDPTPSPVIWRIKAKYKPTKCFTTRRIPTLFFLPLQDRHFDSPYKY